MMATKAVSLRLDEMQISDIKSVAEVYNKSFTDIIRDAVDEYLPKMKNDPIYILTMNVEEVDDEENKLLTEAIESMSVDDLEIVRTEVEDI